MKMEKDNCTLCYIDGVDVIEHVKNKIDDIVLELQKVRIAKNISLYKIAQMTGLAHTTIMRIENYSKQPSLEAIMRIAIALDVELDIFDLKHQQRNLEQTSDIELNMQSEDDAAKPEIDMLKLNKYSEIKYESDIQPDGKDGFESLRMEYLSNIYLSSQTSFLIIAQEIRKSLVYEINAPKYIDEVWKSLDKYTTICKRILAEEISLKISQFSNDLRLVLREYYLGQHTSAYELFAESMNKLNISSLYYALPFDLKLYRARKPQKQRIFKVDDFFHIPFEKRTSVSTQRYSFPGLPCLYMGTSIDVCLRELECNNAIVAELQPTFDKRYNILDLTRLFSTSVQSMSIECQHAFFELLPLIYLCSTKLKERNITIRKEEPSGQIEKSICMSENIHFRPDYIIPQLLLEYILDKTVCTENPIVGIQYYSVQEDFYSKWLDGNIQELQKMKNIVVPVRTNRNSGHCQELTAMFRVNRILD